MKKKIIRYLPVLLLLFVVTISGVSALWNYATADPGEAKLSFRYEIEDFYYPEDVPEDEENEESHNNLLQKIVDFEDGINNPNSLLSNALKDRMDDLKNNVCSNQQVSGGNLKNKFSNVDGYENVGFLIVFDSDVEYSVYTYRNQDTNRIGDIIETYLTKVYYRNGKWILSGGWKGQAEVTRYDGKTNGSYKNVIDYKTWIETN